MKTSELTGAQLDYWVARANGVDPEDIGERITAQGMKILSRVIDGNMSIFAPHRRWEDGGPIIQRECVQLDPLTRGGRDSDHWQAQVWTPYAVQVGPTPLTAAMRAYVSSKYGDTVPDE